MASTDIGLGAIISLTDGFTGPAGLIAFGLDRLEQKFGIASKVVTHAAKRMAIGMGLLGGSYLINRTFRPHIKNATEFQEAMTEVSTLTENATGEIQKLSREILTSSSAMGQMPVETASLLYQTISGGATDAAERLMVMNQAQMTATAGLADQNDVLDLLGSAVKSYGLEWSAVTEISDKAFQTVKLGKTTMGELAVSMQQLFAPAAALGISMDELFGFMATLTGVTGNTNEVATQLGSVMTSLLKPTSQAEEKAKELGIEWSRQGSQAKGLSGLLEELRLKTKGNTDALGDLIGRKEGIIATLALIGSQAETSAEKIGAVANATGESRIAFDKMAATMAFAQRQFAAARQSLSVLIGQPLIEAMRPVIRMLTSFTQAIVKFVANNPLLMKIITTIAYGTAVLLAFAGALFIAGGALIFLKTLPLLVALGIFALASSLFSLKLHLLVLKYLTPLAMKVITFSLKLFRKELFLTILPMIGLIAGLYVLYKVFAQGEGIGRSFRNAFAKVSLIWSSLTELMETFDGTFGKMTKSTADKLRKAGLFETTVKLFMLWARAKAFWEGVKDGFVGAFDEMANAIRWLLPEGNLVRDLFEGIAKAIKNMGLDSSIEDWKDWGKVAGFALATLVLMTAAFKIATVIIKIYTTSAKLASFALVGFSKTLAGGQAVLAFLGPIGILVALLAVLAIIVWRNRDAFAEFWKINKGTPLSQIVDEFAGWLASLVGLEAQYKKLKKTIIDFWRFQFGQQKGQVSDELWGWLKTGFGTVGGPKAEGMPIVDRDQIVQVHQGEAIIPKKINPFLGRGLDVRVSPQERPTPRIREMPGLGELRATPVIVKVPTPQMRPAAPVREDITLTVNLDGEVIHRQVVERERRESLRGGD